MRKGILDEVYYFYKDGHILYLYVKTQTKLNIEEYVSADSIFGEKRKVMLAACPNEIKSKIAKLFEFV